MIKVVFFTRGETLVGFQISGHSETAESGKDIVCAAVTSAVMLTANTITHSFKLKAAVHVGKNMVTIHGCEDPNGQKVIGALRDHLNTIKTDYPNAIKINTETEDSSYDQT